MKPTDIMEYNGQKMTWTKFQEYWRNKTPGGWLYDDANDEHYPENKTRFQNVWALAGPQYCKNHHLEYVDFNQRQSSMNVEGVHFIFALDESKSMRGQNW